MSQNLVNLIGKTGRVIKNGKNLSSEQAVIRSNEFHSANGYIPRVVAVAVATPEPAQTTTPAETTGVATIAVAQARITCRMGRYIWRHQRAVQDKTVRARNGSQMEKFHWSGILSMAMNNAEITGKRLDFLNEKFAQIKSAVEAHEVMGSTYTILDPDKAEFYFGK